MRWFIEVSSLGKSVKDIDSHYIEASQWHEVIKRLRREAGLDEALGNFSIELLDDGVRVMDPINRLLYLILRAPEDPSEARLAAAPPAQAISVRPAPSAPTQVPQGSSTSSQPAAISSEPEQPSSEPEQAVPEPDDFSVVSKREEPPSQASPLAYREYAYAIREGSSEKEAEAFIRKRFEEVRESLSSVQAAKLVNLAVFDHEFKGRPLRAPLVTLVWKDWKGEPEVRYTTRPGASIPPPSLGGLEAASTKKPDDFDDSEEEKPFRLSTPAATPSAKRRSQAGALSHAKTLRSEGAPPSVRSQEKSKDKIRKDDKSVTHKPVSKTPAPKSSTKSAPKMASARTPVPSADEIITDVFESMHDLHFLRDPYEGADFVIALALDKFNCTHGIVQLYDINRREFVVIHAVGPNATKAIGNRTPESDPLLVEIMKRRLPFLIEGTDERLGTKRWENLGGKPCSVLACSVAQGGRFLGVLEFAHTDEKRRFRKVDMDAVAYIAESFAEFSAKAGLFFGGDAEPT